MRHVWPLPRIDYLPWPDLREERAVALVCDRGAWNAVRSRIRFEPVWTMEPREATLEAWRAGAEGLRGEVVYAVGGGLATDAAKLVATERGLPLVSLPTALTVDAFFTWASGYRMDGCVRYLETKPPDRVVVDFEVWAAAPAPIRAAGICDVLSIATGLWDWRRAHALGRNPAAMRYDEAVARMAEAILDDSLACAESAGRGEAEGLERLLRALALEVQLCNLIGHSRPEEGSEHYFAYAVENVMGKGLPHGDLVGPGILVAAALQGLEIAPLRDALRACSIPLGNIPREVVLETLRGLPAYSERHGLPYGIAHELTPEAIARLDLSMLA